MATMLPPHIRTVKYLVSIITVVSVTILITHARRTNVRQNSCLNYLLVGQEDQDLCTNRDT